MAESAPKISVRIFYGKGVRDFKDFKDLKDFKVLRDMGWALGAA